MATSPFYICFVGKRMTDLTVLVNDALAMINSAADAQALESTQYSFWKKKVN